jgi:phage shock protein PspC (stress-responsive transcriptional regulator)
MMASCYKCGKVIVGLELRQRRQVYTGESYWTLWARRRQSSHRTHFGMRIVCAGCANKLDWSKGAYKSRLARLKWLIAVLVTTAAFIAILLAIMNAFLG